VSKENEKRRYHDPIEKSACIVERRRLRFLTS
jgi:hypothetical protein